MSTVTIAPHLWRALELMSKDMGVEPTALTNQAVFAWLRINGYVLPGTAALPAQPTTPSEILASTPATVAAAIPEEPPTSPAPMAMASAPAPAVASPAVQRPASSSGLESGASAPSGGSSPVLPPVVSAPAVERPVARPAEPVADAPAKVVERIAEIDAALEKLTRPRRAWARVAKGAHEEAAAEEPAPAAEDTGDDSRENALADQEEPAPTDFSPTGELPVTPPPPAVVSEEEPAAERTVFVRSAPVALFIQRENQEPIPVRVERFIIGRGPQCDLVIDSPRVSREHVAITRKGVIFVLDDLGSSNGTWFNEERLANRELEDGDTILLGNEAVTFLIRPEA